jgi:hypothetical protein
MNDEHADRTHDILENNRSALSGKTLETLRIAGISASVYNFLLIRYHEIRHFELFKTGVFHE